eukprot:Gb_30166 [translate_table: standard]
MSRDTPLFSLSEILTYGQSEEAHDMAITSSVDALALEVSVAQLHLNFTDIITSLHSLANHANHMDDFLSDFDTSANDGPRLTYDQVDALVSYEMVIGGRQYDHAESQHRQRGRPPLMMTPGVRPRLDEFMHIPIIEIDYGLLNSFDVLLEDSHGLVEWDYSELEEGYRKAKDQRRGPPGERRSSGDSSHTCDSND